MSEEAQRAADDGALTWLLIAGAPRSGTTLLRNLIDEHPQASILLEYGLPRLIGALNLLAGRPAPVRPSWAPFAEAPTPLGEAAAFYVRRDGEESVQAGDLGACGFDGLSRALFERMSGKAALRLVGDKAPLRGESEDLDAVLHRLPELRLLLIARDPAMVIRSSMIRRARQRLGADIWPVETVQEAALEWWLAWRRAAELMERFGDRARLIRYEDLVAAPDPTLERLWRWLGLDPHFRRTPVEAMPAAITDLSEREQAVAANLLGAVSVDWTAGDVMDRLRAPAPPRPYAPSSRLLAASAEADDALAEGFSMREPWGRWTDGPQAVVRLRHGEPDGLALLEIETVRAFAHPGGACDVVLRLPSGAAQLFSLGPDGGRLAALCDLADARKPGVLEAELLVVRPKGVHEPPADERRLGVGVEAVSLRLLP